jgi:hypothetical protein
MDAWPGEIRDAGAVFLQGEKDIALCLFRASGPIANAHKLSMATATNCSSIARHAEDRLPARTIIFMSSQLL